MTTNYPQQGKQDIEQERIESNMTFLHHRHPTSNQYNQQPAYRPAGRKLTNGAREIFKKTFIITKEGYELTRS